MVRIEEDGLPNFTAGIDLINELYTKYKYSFEVLIYCGDVESANLNCKQR